MVAKIVAALIAGGSVLSCDRAAMKETSAAFDLGQVRPFLMELTRDFDAGFDSATAERVYGKIAALPVDGTSVSDFTVTFHGASTPLQLIANMDDLNSPDLAFRAPPPLAQHIDSVLREFLIQGEL